MSSHIAVKVPSVPPTGLGCLVGSNAPATGDRATLATQGGEGAGHRGEAGGAFQWAEG